MPLRVFAKHFQTKFSSAESSYFARAPAASCLPCYCACLVPQITLETLNDVQPACMSYEQRRILLLLYYFQCLCSLLVRAASILYALIHLLLIIVTLFVTVAQHCSTVCREELVAPMRSWHSSSSARSLGFRNFAPLYCMIFLTVYFLTWHFL